MEELLADHWDGLKNGTRHNGVCLKDSLFCLWSGGWLEWERVLGGEVVNDGVIYFEMER